LGIIGLSLPGNLTCSWEIFCSNTTNFVNFQHFESRRTIHSYFEFSLKNSSFRLPYQRPSSSTDCAKKLFKGSNGSGSV